jgi:hypothetical protein
VNEALATISAPLLMPDEKDVFEEADYLRDYNDFLLSKN